MFKLLLTLHVLAAVLLVGPFLAAAFVGHRAIRRRYAPGARDAAKTLAIFAGGTLLVALLGAGTLSVDKHYSFRTPWIIISITLWVLALGIATGYTLPALRRAANMIDDDAALALEGATRSAEDDDQDARQLTHPASAEQIAAKQRLDMVAARIGGSALLVLLAFVIITVLMVTRPFGK